MGEAAGFNHQPVRLVVAQHFGYSTGHLRPGHAAQAAAGDFGHGNAVVAEHGAVDADFTEFVDDNHPFFRRVFLCHQAFERGGFAHAQKAGKQMYAGFVYCVC